MLDNETKRRIDTCRDILVGKVPDPKSQVEQISIALIYKFMDDMDREAVEMGGKAGFFTGDYVKYAWSKIFDPRLGGFDMLALYSEAITRMSQNPGIPQLFRDIFKNAYLPYRDPETLKLFLKTINEFSYDHSERLGDAFEYLLSVLGSQGDAGQFRTPRHIIDFMVEVVKPQKHESILDPACGTAGFLISSYKHILRANTKKVPGDLLKTEERKKLLTNFKGYDISPDMVRLSLVNLYLHGFVQPQVMEYDTLTSEDRWNEYADVILANPPFMTPKGGIKPHKKFSVQSNRCEVLFVDYIIEHLTTDGKAGIIVPEGILFVEDNSFIKNRQNLIDNNLIAVITLPHGVFKPYASVKTHILVIDKKLAKKSDYILFADVISDGFTQSDTRLKTDDNDLPDVLATVLDFKMGILNGIIDINKYNGLGYTLVKKEDILLNKINHLIGRWYCLEVKMKLFASNLKYKRVGNICNIYKGLSSNMKTLSGDFPLVVPAEDRKTSDHFDFDDSGVCIPLVSSAGHGKAEIKRLHFQENKFALANTMCFLVPKNKNELHPKYLFETLRQKKDEFLVPLMAGATNVTMKPEQLEDLYIPVIDYSLQLNLIEFEVLIETLDRLESTFLYLKDHSTKNLQNDLDMLNSIIEQIKIKIDKMVIPDIWV